MGSSFAALYFWTRHTNFLDLTFLICKTDNEPLEGRRPFLIRLFPVWMC